MSVTLPDPAARLLKTHEHPTQALLDLYTISSAPAGGAAAAAGAPNHPKGHHGREEDIMRRRKSGSFTVYTASGRGSYRSHSKADAAARWVSQETGESVSVVNEGTGQSWEVIARTRVRSVVILRGPSWAVACAVPSG